MHTGHNWRYTPSSAYWDEAVLPSGMPRRHWRKLAVSVGRMGPDELTRRWQAGQQLIQSHGITYNIYGDARGMERPWSLDPIPLVIDGQEWANLESAVIQRATLLNQILMDLYGGQRLIQLMCQTDGQFHGIMMGRAFRAQPCNANDFELLSLRMRNRATMQLHGAPHLV